MRESKMNRFFALCVLFVVSGCNYPTPKMACKDQLEDVYRENCAGALVFYQLSPDMESFALLTCAQYLVKKDECDKKLY